MADVPVNAPNKKLAFWRQALPIYICAALGGFIASVADLVQKQEASAIAKLTSTSARLLQLVLVPTVILAVLVIMAAALCFVFEPINRKQAFITGLGIVATVMTITPYQQPNTGLPTNITERNAYLPQVPAQAMVLNAAFIEVGTNSTDFILRVNNETNDNPVIGISVLNPATGEQFYQKNQVSSGTSQTFYFSFPNDIANKPVPFTIDVNGSRLGIIDGQVNAAGPTEVTIKGDAVTVLTGNVRKDFTGVDVGNHQNDLLKQWNKPFKW